MGFSGPETPDLGAYLGGMGGNLGNLRLKIADVGQGMGRPAALPPDK